MTKIFTLKQRIGEKEGAKLDYSKVKKAILKCELDKNDSECKKALEELGIERIE